MAPSLFKRDLGIAVAALVPVVAWDASGLDLAVQRLFGSADGFAWRSHWFTSLVLHQGGRALAWVVVALLALNVVKPLLGCALTRGERLRWLLVTLVVFAVVPLVKDASATSCPWSLAEFGGNASYVSHWRWGVGDGGPGRCFPSGHATSAAAFFTGWFALRRQHPRAARLWLAAVLMLTVLLGGAQVMRGAHYVSHVLWAAWLCWGVATLTAPRPVVQPAYVATP
ncbi:membrane-associated PAP2 superfamily phosphatase [Rubrivivax gelatinosus]|uniref:phosphatase PAP2 family protein n=2 Tax=Rubrivivax gelatinosus TaxID=28068 RepID=UPI0018CA0190|nr:phosphatase PAP2 family protein [Rubrivivax gelatinosus]MBG6079176.1 membrane-associated PAP2 superfamily phosphatase [Rubrivivax gelatinosus]